MGKQRTILRPLPCNTTGRYSIYVSIKQSVFQLRITIKLPWMFFVPIPYKIFEVTYTNVVETNIVDGLHINDVSKIFL